MHRERVCEIDFFVSSLELQRLAPALQKPFPALIRLSLASECYPTPVLPDGFLGGSAPSLRSLELNKISLPALPRLLSSATNLVSFSLRNILRSECISPEVLVTHLAMLSHLESLNIDFKPPPSRPDRPNRRPPLPTTCSIFPALTRILFFGDSDYLEDLVARIDAPLLDSIGIMFCRSFKSDIPQLAQFMRRTTRIQRELQALKEAYVNIDDYGIVVQSPPRPSTTDKMPALRISCGGYGWQYTYLVQAFMSLFPSIFMVERHYIYGAMSRLSQDDVEDIQLLECFPAFNSFPKRFRWLDFFQTKTLQGG